MKVAITGESRGVGKAVADYFRQNGYEVVGFSRSSGYDLTKQEAIRAAIPLIADTDLFVNNFYNINLQLRLLARVHEKWQGQEDKRIIVMGSVASETSGHDNAEYAGYKAGLDKMVRNLQGKSLWPRIHLLKFGMVDTMMSAKYDKTIPRMQPEHIISVIDWILNAPSPITIQEVIFRHDHQVLRMG